jgi:hypothetical protein
MHRHRFHDDHGGAAYGALGIVAHVPLGRDAFDGHVGGMRAEDNAIAKRLAAQFRWREQSLEMPFRHGLLPKRRLDPVEGRGRVPVLAADDPRRRSRSTVTMRGQGLHPPNRAIGSPKTP